MARRPIIRSRRFFSAILQASLIVGLGSSYLPAAASPPAQGEGLRIGRSSETGKVTFIGADPRSPFTLGGRSFEGLKAEDAALAYIDNFAEEIGLKDPASELELARDARAGQTGTTVRYQQVYQGVPVLAGELIIHTDDQARLLSISGEIAPDLSLSVEPEKDAGTARANALKSVARTYKLDPGAFTASEPELWIYDERLLLPSSQQAELVWRMDVRGIERLDVNELVLVNARTGGISLHFNQIDAALYREIYDNNNNPAAGLPGTGPVRTEGDAAVGIADVDKAYDYAGDTYDFYMTYHGRDSLDSAGMSLVSTVRYCDPYYACPYANAFWTGAPEYQMVYGQGYASADDVVGHELTHGVTNFESDLFYYYQSGAINESFSDIWGEFIDQTNGAGTDTVGVKWLMGEDVPGGAIRSMSSPTVYGDPDRMSSANYWTSSGDNGGVHSNSGINNKAAYLMTDGASFNGFVVTGLGIAKVAAIYYDVQTTLLTSGSDYGDLNNMLYQSCLGLVGGAEGITLGDCNEVSEAAQAVEMDEEPEPGFNPEASICPSGTSATDLFYDDLEGGTGNWTAAAIEGSSSWYDTEGYAHGGVTSLYGNDYYAHYDGAPTDSYAAMNADVSLPEGPASYLWFAHAFGFETPNYDGGFVERSTNSGGSWTDSGSLIDSGLDYTGAIYPTYNNPNAGHAAYIGTSHGYVSTRMDLTSLAGQPVRFRWRMSSDDFGYELGWLVDDVRIFSCDPLPLEAGAHDDTDERIQYFGSWGSASVGGAYNGTLHYSNDPNARAFLAVDGSHLILLRTLSGDRGDVDVYVDGAFHSTMENYSTGVSYQSGYPVMGLGSGEHQIELRNASPGSYMDVDGVRVVDALGDGKYDDSTSAIAFDGMWGQAVGGSYYNGTLHYSADPDARATLPFEGTDLIVLRTMGPDKGNVDVYVDGVLNSTMANEFPGHIAFQSGHMINGLSSGTHVLELRNASPGTYMDLDGLVVLGPFTPDAELDDDHINIAYEGEWLTYDMAPLYGGGFHWTGDDTAKTQFTFTGTTVKVMRALAPDRGQADVYVDGLYHSTMQNYLAGALGFQSGYLITDLANATHVVELRNASSSVFMDLDGVVVYEPLGVGTYDDADQRIAYNGSWDVASFSGPANDTLHYSSKPDAIMLVRFSGDAIRITRTLAPDRGNVDVYVDGVYHSTYSSNGAGIQFQQDVDISGLGSGAHTLELRNASPGTYMDVDAIEVLP